MAGLAGPSRAGEDVVSLNRPGCRVAVQYVARIDAILCTQCRPDRDHLRSRPVSELLKGLHDGDLINEGGVVAAGGVQPLERDRVRPGGDGERGRWSSDWYDVPEGVKVPTTMPSTRTWKSCRDAWPVAPLGRGEGQHVGAGGPAGDGLAERARASGGRRPAPPGARAGCRQVKPLSLPEMPAPPAKAQGEPAGRYWKLPGPTTTCSNPGSATTGMLTWATASMKAVLSPPAVSSPWNVTVCAPAVTVNADVESDWYDVPEGVKVPTTMPSTRTWKSCRDAC